MNLHHTGAYSIPPVDTNVNVNVNLPVDPTQNLAGKKKQDNNPNRNPDPMTARTSPTWDRNPNHKPDPMKLYAFNSPVMNLHHTGAYSVPPVDANVNVNVNVPVDPTQITLGRRRDNNQTPCDPMRANCGDNNPSQTQDPMTTRTSPTWDHNPNHKPDPMNLHHTGAYSIPPIDQNLILDAVPVNVNVNVPTAQP